MDWCVPQPSLIDPCVVDSLDIVLAAIFLGVFLYRAYSLYRLEDSIYLYFDSTDLIFKNIFIGFSVVLAATAICFSFDDLGSVSVLLSSLMEAAAYSLCALCVAMEFKKSQKWPSLYLKVYFALELILNVLQCVSKFEIAAEFVESLVTCILCLIVVLTYVIKDVWFSDEEEVFDFNNTASPGQGVKYSSLAPPSDSSFSFSNSLFGFKLRSFALGPKDDLPLLTADTNLEDPLFFEDTGRSSFASRSSRVASRSSLSTSHHDVSDLLAANDIHYPIVQSALDKHLVESPAMASSQSNVKKDLTISTPKSHSANSLLASPSRNSTTPTKDSDTAASGALQRALNQQKSKMSSVDSGLSPKGSSPNMMLRSSNLSQNLVDDSTSPSNGSQLSVSVHRWGIRRAEGLLPAPKSPLRPKSSQKLALEHVQQQQQLADEGKDDDDFDEERAERINSIELDFNPNFLSSPTKASEQSKSQSNLKELHSNSEIEFEICISVGSQSNYSNSGVDSSSMLSSEQEWWGINRKRDPANSLYSFQSGSGKYSQSKGKWSLWKTGSEVLAFHSSLQTVLGETSARRPRLKSALAENGSTLLSRHEISDDMRAISAYLNLLLRGILSMPAQGTQILYNFLQLSENSRANSTNNLSISQSLENVGGLSLMESDSSLFSIEASKVQQSQQIMQQKQEKWRKLFMAMRMKIKPSEIGVRCRLFEGVMTGADIAAWLMTGDDKRFLASKTISSSVNSDSNVTDVDENSASPRKSPTNGNSTIIETRTRSEASAIGQELLNCGLLVVVAAGYEADDELNPSNDGGNSVPAFFDLHGYIYRFGDRSGTAASGGSRIQCTVFGALCRVSVLEWSHVEDNMEDDVSENASVARDSIMNTRASEVFFVANNGKESKGHIEYLVDVNHGGDNWKIWKRFREFEQLHRSLVKEGIKLDVSLPSKSFSKALGRSVSQSALESRKLGLESYLSAAVEAVISSNNAQAIEITAQFLDEDHLKLRMTSN